MRLILWGAAVIALSALLAAPAAAEMRTFNTGRYGALEIQVPDGWTMVTQDSDDPGGRALRFEPAGDIPFVFLLTPFPNLAEGAAFDPSSQAREIAAMALEGARTVAEEKTIALRTLTGPDCVAHYFSVTDRTVTLPTPGDYKYGTQGGAATGRMLASFTVLTDLKDPPELGQALELIRTLRHVTSTPATVTLTYPGENWSLLIDLPGFELEPVTLREDGKGVRLNGERPGLGFYVSVFLEPATAGRTAAQYRDEVLKSLQKREPEEENVERSEKDGIARLEYRLSALNHVHMNGVLVRDGVWIDVHLSKVMFKPEDRDLFENVFWSVRFSDRVRP